MRGQSYLQPGVHKPAPGCLADAAEQHEHFGYSAEVALEIAEGIIICKIAFCWPACKVLLLVKRMCKDWDRLPYKRAWGEKSLLKLHLCCGAFLHFKGLLQGAVSNADFQAAEGRLQENFMMGFIDLELEHALDEMVPPGEIGKLPTFRPPRNLNWLFAPGLSKKPPLPSSAVSKRSETLS